MSAKLLLHEGSDFHCPHCGEHLSVKWENEEGNPEVGLHKEKCPNEKCAKVVTFEVSLNYSVWK